MKKVLSLFLVFCLVLGITAFALAAGSPKITRQPTSQTTDKNGKVTLSFQGSNFTPNDSYWQFINPDTGTAYTGPQLREYLKDVKGFKLTASDGKRVLVLQNVPESLNGWEVYCHLVNGSESLDTDHFRLWVYGMEHNQPDITPAPTATPTPAATAAAGSGKDTDNSSAAADTTGTPDAAATEDPDATATPETTVNELGELVTVTPTPEPPKEITVTADKVTLYTVDNRGNFDETSGTASMTFTGSGNVGVRSDSPVKYWMVNGMRVEPVESVTSFVLKNVTEDLKISAKLISAAAAEDEVDPDSPCQVTCSGCVFTYHAAGLASAESGTVPSGATIIVSNTAVKDGEGYTINGEGPDHIGEKVFRIKITEDTEITCP